MGFSGNFAAALVELLFHTFFSAVLYYIHETNLCHYHFYVIFLRM